MSSALSTRHPAASDDDDRFRFGWRFVPRQQADGSTVMEQVPLTLEDLLHPKEGDVYVENSVHERDRRYLQSVFEQRLAQDPTALALSDCQVDLGLPGVEPIVPDITVVFGVRRRRPVYRTFKVIRERVGPKILVEVVSPDSRVNDTEVKLRLYHQARVPLYIIVDREQDEGPVRILGYRYTPQRYARIRPDARGRIALKPLGLLLGVKDNRVVLYDAATDEEIGDYQAITQIAQTEATARRAAEARAEAESAARRAAEAQAAELQARVQELENRLRRRNGRPRAGG
jgi:Uma2 family endonuclease